MEEYTDEDVRYIFAHNTNAVIARNLEPEVIYNIYSRLHSDTIPDYFDLFDTVTACRFVLSLSDESVLGVCND